MGDLCELAGPFSETLRTIREELAKGIYSDYYLADSDALAFDQLPYFIVVERLAGEKVRLAGGGRAVEGRDRGPGSRRARARGDGGDDEDECLAGGVGEE